MKARRKGAWLCVLLAMLLLPGLASAEEILRVEDRGLDLNEEISVHYPAVSGMTDETLQAKVNDQILSDLGVREYLSRAAQLISGGALRTEWQGSLLGDVFSGVLSAEGALETSRTTQAWRGCSVDLRDGHAIALSELFTDETAAREMMEAYLEETVAPQLSPLLQNNGVTPLPEAFCLEETGLRLLYPIRQLSTLSDRAGAVRISWYDLREVLDLREDSIPCRLGVEEWITLTESGGKKLLLAAEEGRLPGIPAGIGDNMKELTDRYHMLTDPDGFEDGRLFALEDASFRGVYLMTDDLTRGWEDSRVQGIRMDLGCVYGLAVGETERSAWLEALGAPEMSAPISEEKAEAQRLLPGNCDYYRCGAYQLRLYSDAEEKLISIALTE